MIRANHCASATRSKCIMPSMAAVMPPTAMPISTAMLDRNPVARRDTSRIVASTSAAMAILPPAA
ncbi:hypothetical protein MGSAQ_000785 [marine sediment metagenome]|uniref:Uncharacterized protein n=1 Tax=marine sediment metagenome TaxID=412755 RepID=A0A1B6NWI7_9ZZZZ